MPYLCGYDCSGTPDLTLKQKPDHLYVIGFVGIPSDAETVRAVFAEIRAQCKTPHYEMAADEEFRGAATPELVHFALLKAAVEMGLKAAIAVYDFGLASDIASPRKITAFRIKAALQLFGEFVKRYQVVRLWCDEDIQGAAQAEFETNLQSCHRAAWPGTRMKARHRPSKNIEMIQLADILVYCVSRQRSGSIRSMELQKLVDQITTDPENIVIDAKE